MSADAKLRSSCEAEGYGLLLPMQSCVCAGGGCGAHRQGSCGGASASEGLRLERRALDAGRPQPALPTPHTAPSAPDTDVSADAGTTDTGTTAGAGPGAGARQSTSRKLPGNFPEKQELPPAPARAWY